MDGNDFFDIIKYTYTKYGKTHLYSALYSALYAQDYSCFSQYNVYDTEFIEKNMQTLIEKEAKEKNISDINMVFLINLLNNYARIVEKKQEPSNELEDILLSSKGRATISLYRLISQRVNNEKYNSINPEIERKLRDYENRLDGQDIIENIIKLMTDEFEKEIKYSEFFQDIEENENKIEVNRFYPTTARNCAILSGIRDKNAPETQSTIDKGGLNIVSSIGNQREENQDSGIIMTHPKNKKLKMIAVCDGAGGMEEGGIASDILVELIKKWFIKNGKELFSLNKKELNEKVKEDFDHINEEAIKKYIKRTILDKLKDNSNNNIIRKVKSILPQEKVKVNLIDRPGSTLAMAIIYEGKVIAINVGDSRVYAKKDGKLYQISRDQSIVQELYDNEYRFKYPEMKLDDMRFHKLGNLSSLFFQKEAPEPHVIKISEPDLVMVCSDGMSDCLSFDEIAYISGNTHGNKIANYLVRGANIRKAIRPSYLVDIPGMSKREIQPGKDNSTVATANLKENSDKGGYDR